MNFHSVDMLNGISASIGAGNHDHFDVVIYQSIRQIIRTQGTSTRWGIKMLMEDQNFHLAKKRIVVCVLFMGKYFLICKEYCVNYDSITYISLTSKLERSLL